MISQPRGLSGSRPPRHSTEAASRASCVASSQAANCAEAPDEHAEDLRRERAQQTLDVVLARHISAPD